MLLKFDSPSPYSSRDLQVHTESLTFSVIIPSLAAEISCSLALNGVLLNLNMQEIP